MRLKKRVLLTGASGTVGFEVLKQLYELNDEYELTIFDVKSAKTIKKFKPYQHKTTTIFGNISDEHDLAKACKHQDVVIHLAAIIPPAADDNPTLAYKVNVLGTQILIRLLELHSPNAFLLYSSSISVYGDRLLTPMINVGDPLSPSEGDEYAKTKLLAEESIKNSKLDWSIFRLAAIMGGHKVSKLMFHQPLKTSLEIASPKDTARAFVNAINKQSLISKTIYNLGGGESCRISYEDFLKTSFEIFGLGALDFPAKAFAERNFHCGYYEDGHILNDLINFREDDLARYFEEQRQQVSPIKKLLISILRTPIKKYLQNQSEPLVAYKNNDKKMIEHFFNI